MSTTPERPVIILGGKGIGLTTAAILEHQAIAAPLGFLVDDDPVGTQIGRFGSFPVLGRPEDVLAIMELHRADVISVWVGMSDRRAMVERIQALSVARSRWRTVIDESAYVPTGYCDIGVGCLLMPNSKVGSGCELGDHVMAMSAATLGHDCVIKDHAALAARTCIGGNVTVGEGAFVGSGAVVRDGVSIGDYAFVGMGSVVTKDVAPGAIVLGNPARPR